MELAIPVAGGEVWAEDTGGDGPPLVLMHPGWGDSAIWDPVTGRYGIRRGGDGFPLSGYSFSMGA